MGKNSELLFKRVEKKFLLTYEQYLELKKRIADHTVADTFSSYPICNIYYDTDDFYLIRYSLEKPAFKQKLRLRSYGIPNDDKKVFFEIKKKHKGVVYKRRIKVPYKVIKAYLNDGVTPDLKDSEMRTFQELDYFYKSNALKPKVYLAYDREAFVDKDDKEFRITFDSNIRSRDYDVDFSFGDHGEKLLKNDERLLELKINGAIPLWFVKILDDLKIYTRSFSKYGNVFLELMKQRRNK